jgi:ATP-binding cassette subfamily B protein
MIAKHYGKSYKLEYLRQKCQIQRHGVSMLGISDAAELIGFNTLAVKINYETLSKEASLPCIIHWNQNHFVVVYKITDKNVWISDPGKGQIKLSPKDFIPKWVNIFEKENSSGVALLLEPSGAFSQDDDVQEKGNQLRFSHIFNHFKKYKALFIQLILGMLIGLILQVIVPFLTQSVVDVGIAGRDINFITLVLAGQLAIFIGSTVVDFIKSWIILHISTRVNIALLTEFFIKLMKLPMSFFDAKMTGDIMQRMGDHSRIQSFVTGTLITTVFSIINFIVFTFLAITYDISLFIIFATGSIIYLGWTLLFLPTRRKLDFKRFDLSATNQNLTIEMIHGMQEIKLNNAEKQKRWKWEYIQAKLFKLSIKSLFINQVQSSGAILINQGKNILITFITAKEVINGTLTLGGMMAVQYIIGQLNSPIQQIVQFIQSLQDARISLTRINEIQEMADEDPADKALVNMLPAEKHIELKNISYKYPGYDNNYVLKDLQLLIPQGKTTAIVGMSGSGKTTLLKLLLRFYDVEEGEIRVGGIKIKNFHSGMWRSKCGVVMQEGFIFSDTIAANIAVGEDYPDEERLLYSIHVANIQPFIESLPMGLNTRIGAQGNGISQGQKQRILIARAVYKNPEYIFFDEATNSLDANNESVIMKNLESFLKEKTVVVVAHRLSTVKNADQIIVLDQGKIKEVGTHAELINLRSEYYQLVKNQLELGN